jgi:hypothetical protein
MTSITKISSPLKPTEISQPNYSLIVFISYNRRQGFDLWKRLWDIFSLLLCTNGSGALRGKGGKVVKLTIYLHPVSRLRVFGTYLHASAGDTYAWG